jgi:hypothetical protein
MIALFALSNFQAAQAWRGYACGNLMHSSRLGYEPKALDLSAPPGEVHV